MNMQQGNDFLDRRPLRNQDLVTARRYFLQACDILKSVNPSDSTAFVEVYYGLTNVELDMSFKTGLSLEEMELHLRTAEEYGDMAFEKARLSPYADNLAKIKFEQALLKARRVLIEAGKGSNTGEINRLGDKVQRAISGSLQELRDANCSTYQMFLDLAEDWQELLDGLNSG